MKLALAGSHPDDVEAYYDVKDPVCDLVMEAAELGRQCRLVTVSH